MHKIPPHPDAIKISDSNNWELEVSDLNDLLSILDGYDVMLRKSEENVYIWLDNKGGGFGQR